MHDLISVLVATVLSTGGLGSIGWVFMLRPQRRALGATARKTDADADGAMADALAVAVGPFRTAIELAQKEAAKANRRVEQLEAFIRGPDRLWHEEAVREITARGGHIHPPPVLEPLES